MFEDERGRKEEMEEKWEGRKIKAQQPTCMRASALFHWQPCVSTTGNNGATLSFT